MKQCIANITFGSKCDQHLGMYSGMGTGNKVRTSPVGRAPGVDEYCFVVNATSRNITVLVQGNLRNSGNKKKRRKKRTEFYLGDYLGHRQ